MSRGLGNCLVCKPGEDDCWHSIEEALGLEPVAGFNDPDASYSFDEFNIWRRKSDGSLFYGQDRGCSCPSPFENVKTCDDLNAITPNSWPSFVSAFESYGNQKSDPDNDEYTEKIGPKWIELHKQTETLDKVRAMLYDSLPAPSVKGEPAR